MLGTGVIEKCSREDLRRCNDSTFGGCEDLVWIGDELVIRYRNNHTNPYPDVIQTVLVLYEELAKVIQIVYSEERTHDRYILLHVLAEVA